LIGSVASACSSDRLQLSESPFSNPFATSQRLAAVDPQPAPQAPAAAQVAAMPTAPVQAQALPPISAPTTRAVASNAPVTSSSGGWSAAGGTRITVAASDNINAISQRYGVPTQAILQANGLANAGQVQPGSSLVIPVYNAAGSSPAPTRVASIAPVAAPTPSRVAAAPAPAAPQPKFRFVEGPKPAAQPAEAPKTRVRPGMTSTAKAEPVQPAKAAPAAFQTAKAAPVQPAPQPVAQKPAEPVKVAAIETKPVAAPAPVAVAPQPQQPAKAPVKEPEETASLPKEPAADFRWPARGRVIAGFGANGGNEGINIAVPEGTPVKAAEAGTVTYAGSEVRGYGNLVLIKHDNGYISAYAHNGELGVKRGERVTRGQVIAKSGQTGNVTSPQLHFEIRKGQTPVDPLSYLGGN
jgi:murein DD-endopeptidase MepM/ murein hydrolase activator NlpD